MAAVIDDYLGPRLLGESCLATEKCYDMMVRMGAPHGAAGLHSYAVSAIDLALWDLKGKLLRRPVYELLGGPARDELFCYSTGGDTDWYMELGFRATKLPCPYGPADGLEGLRKNVEMVAGARELVGDEVELMLDCWMAFDLEYAVRLGEELRPCKLKWMEEVLRSEELDAHAELRRRLPWQTLATGEHWYTTPPFQQAASRFLVDILQPDINWVGGLTALVKICAIAEAAGISVIPHGGGNTPYGQHACYAMPAIPWTECFVGSAPGVPPEQAARMPGAAIPEEGADETVRRSRLRSRGHSRPAVSVRLPGRQGDSRPHPISSATIRIICPCSTRAPQAWVTTIPPVPALTSNGSSSRRWKSCSRPTVCPSLTRWPHSISGS